IDRSAARQARGSSRRATPRTSARAQTEIKKGGREAALFFSVSCPAKAGHPVITAQSTCTGSPACAGDDRLCLLCRDAHFRRGGFHVRRDVIFELGEVLLEHGDEIARRLVELALVLPGLERIEQMR